MLVVRGLPVGAKSPPLTESLIKHVKNRRISGG